MAIIKPSRELLAKLQKRDMPINYSNLEITDEGELQLRKTAKLGLADRVVKGYGVIWNNRNDHGEIFIKGAFSKSIKETGPKSESKYQLKFRDRHGQALSLFEVIKEDDIGLYFETVPLDRIRAADELLVQLESGTINNFSIGFRHMWDKIEWDDEKDALINLEASLLEISAVDIPSDKKTYQVRSAEEIEYLRDDVEDFILSLPGSKRFEARQIFTRCMSLSWENDEPQQENRSALITPKPIETELDLDYIINNFKL